MSCTCALGDNYAILSFFVSCDVVQLMFLGCRRSRWSESVIDMLPVDVRLTTASTRTITTAPAAAAALLTVSSLLQFLQVLLSCVRKEMHMLTSDFL